MRDEVLIIGCGEIGVSLIEGWLNKKNEFSKRISSIHVLEKNLKRKNFLKKKYKKKIYFVGIDRIKKINKFITDDSFLLTYGDGVSNVNIKNLINFHNSHGKLVTMTAAIPEGRFGSISFGSDKKKNQIASLKEKQDNRNKFVNAGFFVVNKKALKYIKNNNEQWENAPLRTIAKAGQLMGFRHHGFWHPMDTLRDKLFLDKLAKLKSPPWKTW